MIRELEKDTVIDYPINLNGGDRLIGNDYKLIAPNTMPMVIVNSSEGVSPDSKVIIRDLMPERIEQAPYMSDLGMYHPDISVVSCTGFVIENVTCHRGGVALYIGKDAHNGFVSQFWSYFNRSGIILGASGGSNMTDVKFRDVQLIGDGTWSNDDYIQWYNCGIWQRAETVGDTDIEGVKVLRFDLGVHLEKTDGNGYCNNLDIAGLQIDQCNDGLFLKGFRNSFMNRTHVMCYTKHARKIKTIIDCQFKMSKMENNNIFRGSVR